MRTENGKVVEETFYLGNNCVTVANANVFFPQEMTTEAKEHFFEKNNCLFDQMCRQLADASRAFYDYEHHFDQQKAVIEQYLTTTTSKVIAQETGVSLILIRQLKKKEKELETKSFQTIETLYRVAAKKKATLNEK